MHGLHVAQLFTLLGSHGEVHAVEVELATAEGAFLLFRGGPEQAEFQAVVGGGSRGGGVAKEPKSAQKLARSGGLTPLSPECLGRAECAPAVQPPEPPLPSRIPPGLDPMGVASHGEPGAVPTRALLQLRHRAVCCCWVVIGFLCGFIVGPKFIFIKRRTVSF